MSVIPKVLNVPEDKIKSKGIKSVKSRVTNLRPYLDKKYQDMTLPEFRDILLTRLFGVDDVAEIKDKEYHVTDADQVEIKKIYDDVYNNWDWVYGHSPEFTTKKRKHFDYGTIDARFDIKDGKIANVKFYGDFFGPQDVADVAAALKDKPYTSQAVKETLDGINTNDYFTNIPKDDVINLLVP